MPTRCIRLKLILDRSNSGQQLRQNVWMTHNAINQAVAAIENVLLLCRGAGYLNSEDELIDAQHVQAQALLYARARQRTNGKPNVGTDGEVLAGLRALYEGLVPSVCLDPKGNPLKGNAQAANEFAGPLMDAQSVGFYAIFDKILDPAPSWIGMKATETPGWESESIAWLDSEQARALLNASGAPPGWVRHWRAGKPWQDEFIKQQEKMLTKSVGIPVLIRKLKDIGLLPLLDPPVTVRLAAPQSRLCPWDRLALRLAVAHMLSWESWNHRARREYQLLAARRDTLTSELAAYPGQVDLLRQYESQRHEQNCFNRSRRRSPSLSHYVSGSTRLGPSVRGLERQVGRNRSDSSRIAARTPRPTGWKIR